MQRARGSPAQHTARIHQMEAWDDDMFTDVVEPSTKRMKLDARPTRALGELANTDVHFVHHEATLALEKERKEASHHVANVLIRDRAQPRPCGAEAQRALGFRDEVPCGLGTLGVGRGVLGLSVTLIGHFGAFCEVFRLARTQRLRQT
eukprot:COSAG05_NODE_8828_length_668_cov_1.177504_1_plen_148_part_00